MSDTINQVNYQAPSFKAESEARAKARKIYSALSKKDSMRIFELAANGIEATTDALANNGFSKKRYYVRLSKLIELGLVEKKAGNRTHTDGKRITYEQTSLGKVIYKEHVLKLEDLIELVLPSEKISKLDPTVASIAEQTRAVAIVGANAH